MSYEHFIHSCSAYITIIDSEFFWWIDYMSNMVNCALLGRYVIKWKEKLCINIEHWLLLTRHVSLKSMHVFDTHIWI